MYNTSHEAVEHSHLTLVYPWGWDSITEVIDTSQIHLRLMLDRFNPVVLAKPDRIAAMMETRYVTIWSKEHATSSIQEAVAVKSRRMRLMIRFLIFFISLRIPSDYLLISQKVI